MTDEHSAPDRSGSQQAKPGRLRGRLPQLRAEGRAQRLLIILVLLGGAILMASLF